jgi:hypothetical protein
MSVTRIRLDLDGESFVAVLNDSAAARDFCALLPLDLTLDDYAATEKISDLPRHLSTTGAPVGAAGVIGTIAYYSPWGNLAIFYRDAAYASGLVILGQIDGDVAVLPSRARMRARIQIDTVT